MRNIAEAAGMLSGSIYYHFASKEEMLVAVYEEGVRRITARVDAAIARNHLPWERLTAACVAHLEALLNRGDYAQVVVRVLPRDAKSAARQLIALRDRYEVRFRRLIDELDLPATINRRYLRLLLMSVLNWAPVWYRPNRDSPETIARCFVDILKEPLLGKRDNMTSGLPFSCAPAKVLNQ